MTKENAETWDYRVVIETADVNIPWATAWSRIGPFDAIRDLFNIPCEYISGSGGLGSIRLVANEVVEQLVGLTATSYTYGQLRGPMSQYDYHATFACEYLSKSSCRIVSSIVYDQASMPASDRESAFDRATKRNRFIVSRLNELLGGSA